MKQIIAKLLASRSSAKPRYFETSDWFEDETKTAIKKVIREYEKHYDRRLQELTELLGKPAQTEVRHGKAIAKWYPEALRAACWIQDGKTLCLALEQHDQETPVAVVLHCLTAEEIAEQSV